MKFLAKLIDNYKKKHRVEKLLKDCGCVCFCDCGEPLNDQVGGQYIDEAKMRFQYKCGACGDNPIFIFGIAPAPIRER